MLGVRRASSASVALQWGWPSGWHSRPPRDPVASRPLEAVTGRDPSRPSFVGPPAERVSTGRIRRLDAGVPVEAEVRAGSSGAFANTDHRFDDLDRFQELEVLVAALAL